MALRINREVNAQELKHQVAVALKVTIGVLTSLTVVGLVIGVPLLVHTFVTERRRKQEETDGQRLSERTIRQVNDADSISSHSSSWSVPNLYSLSETSSYSSSEDDLDWDRDSVFREDSPPPPSAFPTPLEIDFDAIDDAAQAIAQLGNPDVDPIAERLRQRLVARRVCQPVAPVASPVYAEVSFKAPVQEGVTYDHLAPARSLSDVSVDSFEGSFDNSMENSVLNPIYDYPPLESDIDSEDEVLDQLTTSVKGINTQLHELRVKIDQRRKKIEDEKVKVTSHPFKEPVDFTEL